MTFKVGETVVYPHHGTATIIEVSTRKVRGVEKVYLTLQPESNEGITIKVPADNLETVGVRDVVDAHGLEEVFALLSSDTVDEPTNWSRRYKVNVEKIKSNDIMQVAEVVRDLSRRDGNKGLSSGEKTLLSKARQVLSSEIASSKNVDEETASAMLDEILGIESLEEVNEMDNTTLVEKE